MPLDGHSYLVAQGWSGKGAGLRQGAIVRPLAIPQKKTLSGLGKDRDEAFPFWDHLYTIAAKTIQVKLHKDEDNESDSDSSASPSPPALARTSTGILSNKRPITGTPASTPGSVTPSLEESSSSSHPSVNGPRINLLAAAKRESAKRGLYSRFFRGPVLGPYDDDLTDDSKTGSPYATGAAETISSDSNAPVVVNRSSESNIFNSEIDKEGKEKKRKTDPGDEIKAKRGKKVEKKKRRKDKDERKNYTGSVEPDETADEDGRKKRKRKRVQEEECDSEVKPVKKKRKRAASLDDELHEPPSTKVSERRRDKSEKKRDKRSSRAESDDAGTGHQKVSTKEEEKKEKRRRKEEKSEKRRRKEEKAERQRRKAEGV